MRILGRVSDGCFAAGGGCAAFPDLRGAPLHPCALAGCGLKNENMGAHRPSPVTPQLAAATTQPVPPGDSCAAGSPAGTGLLLLSFTVLPATSLRASGRIFQGRASSVGWLTKGKHHGTEQERMCQRWRAPSDSCAKAECGHRWRFGGLLQTFLCCSPCGLHQHPHHGHRGRVAPRCGVHVSVNSWARPFPVLRAQGTVLQPGVAPAPPVLPLLNPLLSRFSGGRSTGSTWGLAGWLRLALPLPSQNWLVFFLQ